MARLSAKDAEALCAFMDELESYVDEDSLLEGMLPGLRSLIRADGIGFNDIDLGAGAVRWLADPPDLGEASDRRREAFELNVQQHPVLQAFTRTGDGRPVRTSDLISAREFHKRDLYNDFYRPLELEHQMITHLNVGGTRLFAIAFFRTNRDFSDRDIAVLGALRPALVLAHRAARAQRDAQLALRALDQTLDHASRGLILLDRDGQAIAAIGDADALTCTYFQAGLTTSLPHELSMWVDEQRRRRELDDEPVLSLPLVKPGSNGGLRVWFLPRTTEREHDGLLLIEQPARGLSAGKLRALSLTPREAQVLQLVAAGKTNDEIATELFISLSTVKKHLENTYRKLDVNSRTAAAARALELTSGTGRPLV